MKNGWKNTVNISYKELFAKLRVNFLFNHPFLSVLALSVPTTFETNSKSAFQTNGSKITIDPEKIEKYNDEEITYLYAHTLLHIVLKHPYRKAARDLQIWNTACNVVVNNILESFENTGSRPADELLDTGLKDKCVEEVYEILYKEEKEDRENDDGSEEQEETREIKVTPDEKGELKANIYNEEKMDIDEVEDRSTSKGDQEKLDGIIIQALTIANRTSNKYSGLEIEINTLIKPQISLHDILKEYLISSLFEKHTTFERPDRRYIHRGLYLPGTKKSNELIEVHIALDSSSSVSLDEYKKFLGVIKEVCEGFYEYKITVIPFDKYVKKDHITSFDSFNPLLEEQLFIPKSDGGTNFNEVLRYLKTTDIRGENLLLVLSDGEFDIDEPLICQTLFVISHKKNLGRFEDYGRVVEFIL